MFFKPLHLKTIGDSGHLNFLLFYVTDVKEQRVTSADQGTVET